MCVTERKRERKRWSCGKMSDDEETKWVKESNTKLIAHGFMAAEWASNTQLAVETDALESLWLSNCVFVHRHCFKSFIGLIFTVLRMVICQKEAPGHTWPRGVPRGLVFFFLQEMRHSPRAEETPVQSEACSHSESSESWRSEPCWMKHTQGDRSKTKLLGSVPVDSVASSKCNEQALR